MTDRRGPRLSIPGLVALLTALVAVVLGVAALVMRGRLPLVSAAPTVLAIAALVLAVPILLWRGYLFIRDIRIDRRAQSVFARDMRRLVFALLAIAVLVALLLLFGEGLPRSLVDYADRLRFFDDRGASVLAVGALAFALFSVGAAMLPDGVHTPHWPTVIAVILSIATALTATVYLAGLWADPWRPQSAASSEVPPVPETMPDDLSQPDYRVLVPEKSRWERSGAGFVVAAPDQVTAYDGATGEIRWRYDLTGINAFEKTPDTDPAHVELVGTGDDAVVRVGHPGKAVVDLDPVTGELLAKTMDSDDDLFTDPLPLREDRLDAPPLPDGRRMFLNGQEVIVRDGDQKVIDRFQLPADVPGQAVRLVGAGRGNSIMFKADHSEIRGHEQEPDRFFFRNPDANRIREYDVDKWRIDTIHEAVAIGDTMLVTADDQILLIDVRRNRVLQRMRAEEICPREQMPPHRARDCRVGEHCPRWCGGPLRIRHRPGRDRRFRRLTAGLRNPGDGRRLLITSARRSPLPMEFRCVSLGTACGHYWSQGCPRSSPSSLFRPRPTPRPPPMWEWSRRSRARIWASPRH